MNTTPSLVEPLTLSIFESTVLKGELPVLIDFWAPWCGPCRMMKPILEEASKSLQGKVKVMTLNVDEEQALAQAFNVQGIPTLVLMQGSRVLSSWSGVRPLPALLQAVESGLAQAQA
jgi:thioredoxin 1